MADILVLGLPNPINKEVSKAMMFAVVAEGADATSGNLLCYSVSVRAKQQSRVAVLKCTDCRGATDGADVSSEDWQCIHTWPPVDHEGAVWVSRWLGDLLS